MVALTLAQRIQQETAVAREFSDRKPYGEDTDVFVFEWQGAKRPQQVEFPDGKTISVDYHPQGFLFTGSVSAMYRIIGDVTDQRNSMVVCYARPQPEEW